MNDRRRSWWGWGWEDQTPDPAQTRAIAGVVAERFGLADLEIHPPVALADLDLPAPRLEPPAALAALCSTEPVRPGRPHPWQVVPRHRAQRAYGQLAHPPDVVARPATEADVVALLDWCAIGRRRGHPLRRRLVGGGGRRGRRRRRLRRRGVDRSHRARSGGRDRPHEPGGAHPGRRARSGARGPAPAPRLHPPPLPPVVRVLDPGRLAGHPLGGPLRRPCTPTSTTWWSPCGWSRRRA